MRLFYSNALTFISEVLYSPFSLSLIPNTRTSASLQELFKSDNFKSIRVLMTTGFTQALSYAPSHPVRGAWVGNFRKRGCPWHPAGKISMTFLICIHFSHRLGTYSRVNFPTCSRLFSPRWASQGQAIVPVDCHFNITFSVKIPWSRARKTRLRSRRSGYSKATLLISMLFFKRFIISRRTTTRCFWLLSRGGCSGS